MRKNRNIVYALVLLLVLSSSALADDGIMVTGLTAPPPPQATGIMIAEDTDGIIYTDATDTLTQLALSFVQAVTRL